MLKAVQNITKLRRLPPSGWEMRVETVVGTVTKFYRSLSSALSEAACMGVPGLEDQAAVEDAIVSGELLVAALDHASYRLPKLAGRGFTVAAQPLSEDLRRRE